MAANASSTPAGSLRRSQRETCVTSGADSGTGLSSITSARASTRSGEPSVRVKTGGSAARAAVSPALARIEVTVVRRERLVLRGEDVDRRRDDE